MDTTKLADLLNGDLATELRSIVQYINHIATIRGPEYAATVDELRAHVHQEVEHALTLAEQIDFLEGDPGTTVPAIPPATGARDALQQDLALEEEQLERYRERLENAKEAGLPDVAAALVPLLQQTQGYVRNLRAALEE